ncbi:hypothetical protein BJX99DRAFT_271539 [Aspergillus californicus]
MGWRLILFPFLFTLTYAHSWVEQLTVIAPNGTFIGSLGYSRGYVSRQDPTFSDTTMSYLLPTSGEANFTSSDNLCMETQRKQSQTEGNPRLQASAGAAIALRYLENGHVTLPENQLGKPKNRGTVYVYGTTNPKENEKLLDVHKMWNKAGTGGDKRGVLLGKRNFDDGRCYEVNSGEISQNRQKEFPHEADQYMGVNLWCQSDVAIPASAPSGKPYTLYWVWDWPTAPNIDPGLPNGKEELYTSCMDVDVVDHTGSRMSAAEGYVDGQSLNSASIPDQFQEILDSNSGGSGEVSASTHVTTPAPSSQATYRPVATVYVNSFVTSIKVIAPSETARV